MEDILRPAIYLFVLGYSCILHECAHVWSAWKLGDPTGKSMGRLTLNPLPHIDFFWTILLPLMTYFAGSFPIGGPKPAPLNPLNFRNPRSGYMLTALAGPASNLLLALLGFLLLWAMLAFAPEFAGSREADEWTISFNALFCGHLIFTNLFLAAFNLIPVPPLDGSRFLQWLLGSKSDAFLHGIERFGFIPVFLVAYFVSPYVLGPVLSGAIILLADVFGWEYASALVMGTFKR